MKRIISEEEKNRKVKKNQLIVGGVLIFLMIFSTLGFAFSNRLDINNEKIKYKDIKFIKDSNTGYWNFKINEIDFSTQYNPRETEDIYISNSLTINNYLNKPLYFVGENPEAVSEIARNLNSFVTRTNYACLENEKCSGDFPVKDCSQDNIIIIKDVKENEENKIYQQENCVFIATNYANQLRYADRFLFGVLGVQ